MKKFLLLSLVLLAFYFVHAQVRERTSRSRFQNDKVSPFIINAGNTLFYTVSDKNEQYDVRIRVNKFGNSISLSYSIPKKRQNGKILIRESAVRNAFAYDTLLTNKIKNYRDRSIFWLSKKNFEDLALTKETKIDLGNGIESFTRKQTSTLKIKFKGKEKMVPVFQIESADQNNKKRFLVLSEASNPLILKMESTMSLTLKEVR